MSSPPPPSRSIHELLSSYQGAIASLISLDFLPPDEQAKAILTVLLVRDELQTRLLPGQVTAEVLLALGRLDAELKTHQPSIVACAKLPEWRALYQPRDDAWWWAVPPSPTEVRAGQFDWLWNGLSVVFLAVSASLVLNTAARFWGGSLTAAGTLTLATQSALTLIVGKGALTQSGRAGWEKFLRSRGIAEYHWQEWNCGAAFGVLVVVGGLHASLPTLAPTYNQRGEQHYLAQRLASALDNYQVALNLRPDYPQAHYNQGLVYEDLQREEEAIAAYRFVVEQDAEAVDKSTWLKANNNLARLYILQGEPRDAVPLLIQALAAIPADAGATDAAVGKVHYSLLKNLGWARLAQQRYVEAEAQLDEAIFLLEENIPADIEVRNRGAGYCLLAQVLDAQDRTDEADRVWESCLLEANAGNPDEDTWLGRYEQRLRSASPPNSEENPE